MFRISTIGLSLKVFVELALGTILEDEIYFLFIMKKAIKLNDIFVTKMTLNLNLSSQLVRNLTLD